MKGGREDILLRSFHFNSISLHFLHFSHFIFQKKPPFCLSFFFFVFSVDHSIVFLFSISSTSYLSFINSLLIFHWITVEYIFLFFFGPVGIPQMCITAIANMQQNSTKEGKRRTLFSKDHDIIPFIEQYWEAMTTMPRRVTQSW